MCTKGQLKDYLEEISNGMKIVKFDYISAEVFDVFFKCKVEESDAESYNKYTKQWIEKFSEFTHTTWIVRNCFPNLKRLVYRKTFCCHRSAQNKSKTSKQTRNLDCKAKIDFRIKFVNKSTLKNDIDLKKGLNMNIKIHFNHSHLVRAPESHNLLKSSSQSDSAFYEYFNDGYSPSMAKCYHELLLIERYGQDSEHIQNASVNPNLRHIIYIFQKKKMNKSIDSNQIIQRKVEALEQSGHTVKYNSINQFVVIITPLMRRVVAEFCIENILIDVTPIHAGPFVMIVYVPTAIGSLPIACAIYTGRSVVIYSQIFLALTSAIECGLEKRFGPKLVSVGNTIVNEALTSMFRRAKIKMDRFQICRELWEWLCNSDNNIAEDRRHDILRLFKSLVYADSDDDAFKIHSDLLKSDIMQDCLHKVEQLWQDWEDWVGAKEISGKHIEVPIVFVKEFLIQKCKSFSFWVMMDVVTNILECHFEKMITAYMDRGVVALYTKFLPKVESRSESIQKVGENEFLVANQCNEKQFYRLNIDSLCCDCKVGAKGTICEHLTEVLTVTDWKYEKTLTRDETALFLKIAGDVTRIKPEADTFGEATTDEMAMSASSPETPESDFITEIKQEDLDPLEDNADNNTIETSDSKSQYEAAMKAVNDEFRRLNKLFKENPNQANMETMTRLAKELAKIRPVEETDFSNIFVQMNTGNCRV